MKKSLSTLVLLVILVISGCNPAEVPGVDRALAQDEHGYLGMQWILHINDYLPNRLPFSDRELESAEWIRQTLLEMGFDENQVEVQTFSYYDETSSWWCADTSSRLMRTYELLGYYAGLERLVYSQNIILTIPGYSAKTIIIGAHYDSVGNPGISDNAGGIALLLENAYRMRDIDHYYTLQYVFFGAEEIGLIGAFYFTDQMSQDEIDNLVLMINADVLMDGPELIYAVAYFDELPLFPNNLLNAGYVLSHGITPLHNSLTSEIDQIASRVNRQYNTELISLPHGIRLASDQLAFLQFGIPVLVFYGSHPVDHPELAPDEALITDIFIGDVLHSERDCLDFIMENHPGRIERALNQFGVFLEEIVSYEFVLSD